MRLFLILFILLPFAAPCQWTAEFSAGLANYQGDLQVKKFSFSPVKPALGLGLSYQLNPKFSLRGSFNYLQLEGGDNINGGNKNNRARNLSFNTRVLEAQVGIEYSLFDLEYRSVSPFLFVGGGVFQFNPWIKDEEGNKVFLQNLGTEGQGLAQYPERKEYNLVQFALPFGGGVKTTLSPRLRLGVELVFRKLFTDYLDDVSTTYADSSFLAQGRGAAAVQYAFRGDELPGGGTYPAAGSQRGNPKNKDWYYSTTIRIGYSMGGRNSGDHGSGRAKLGCPNF